MKIVDPLHKNILRNLKKLNFKRNKKERLWVQKYLGSNRPTRCIKGSEIIKLARQTVAENNLDPKSLTKLLDSLYSKATTFEEVDIAARILGVVPKLRVQLNPKKLNYWLNFTQGWAEVDVLCQSNFTPEEILSKWNIWKKLLLKFSKDKNIHKRRASLVLLTKAVRSSSDKKLADLAFTNTDTLKEERAILITKSVSWILRALIKNHKKKVADYLKANKGVLPKIAIREVSNKLTTGKKSGKKN